MNFDEFIHTGAAIGEILDFNFEAKSYIKKNILKIYYIV